MSSVSSQRASSVVGEGAELLAADELIRSMLSHTNQDRRPLADKEGVQMPQQLLQWAERSNKCEMITQKVSGCPCDLVHISPILARANDGSKGDRVRQALVGSGVTLAVSKDADIGNKKRKADVDTTEGSPGGCKAVSSTDTLLLMKRAPLSAGASSRIGFMTAMGKATEELKHWPLRMYVKDCPEGETVAVSVAVDRLWRFTISMLIAILGAVWCHRLLISSARSRSSISS